MQIFVTGATGFIGGAVAQALLRAGHRVVGLARSEEAAAQLQDRGINPYRGDLTEPSSLLEAVRASDGVIHAGTALSATGDRGVIDRAAVQAMLDVLAGSGKPFLYTSDQLIYGSTGEGIADEQTPLHPPPFIAWRPAVEAEVLAATERGVRAMVIRPVAVYGNNAGGMALFLAQARQQGAAIYIGDGAARWSTVHVDDLAELYLRMLERAPAGTLLCASAEPSVCMRDLMEAIGQAAGVPARSVTLDEARQLMGQMAPVEGFTTNLQVSGEQARRLLGWQPVRPSVLEELRHVVDIPGDNGKLAVK
ncbi:MAG: NAD-dependent epimerase/dehydratase family protein [Roseiflexaceae bacterium]